ncbi:hypothetical protein H9I45_09560 [Polaribacter haliotis]|uniref:Uncharacterized protein n=1 Tax=Polaribacter haliotis TaxID=1888915 RepID=A0A7L8AC58_9FLAO|nr:hypothetical protein [Polaribacter haliotis]QOD59608.1 hypothetical protein H9I45_09560 [Polaribacter haliotis]
MKTIKKLTAVLAITGLLFVSCDKTKKEKVEDKVDEKMEQVENTMEEIGDDISEGFQEMKMKLEDGTEVNYKMDSDGSLAFDNWDGFTIANKELSDIENLDTDEVNTRIENLKGTIASLGNNIPAWLKTDEVMDDIKNIQKEYKNVVDNKNDEADKVKQNIEDLNEKFDDLREELNEVIAKYKKS